MVIVQIVFVGIGQFVSSVLEATMIQNTMRVGNTCARGTRLSQRMKGQRKRQAQGIMIFNVPRAYFLCRETTTDSVDHWH